MPLTAGHFTDVDRRGDGDGFAWHEAQGHPPPPCGWYEKRRANIKGYRERGRVIQKQKKMETKRTLTDRQANRRTDGQTGGQTDR